jgi:hypothetical protein
MFNTYIQYYILPIWPTYAISMLSVCLLIFPYYILNAWTNLYRTWYAYQGTWAHLNGVLHKSLPSVCVSVCVSLLSLLRKTWIKCILPFIARQRLGKHVPAATNTHNNRRIYGRVCLWVCLCIPLSLLGNISVKKFPRQRRIVRGVVLYAVRVVSKESRRLVLPRTSCMYIMCHLYFEFEVLTTVKINIVVLVTTSCGLMDG